MLEAHADIADLTRFAPAYLLGQMARDPRAPVRATRAEFPAAVLFADITGFTRLSKELSEREAAGIEELTRILNEYFGSLIEVIHAHGGDVLKFAGDALLAWWPAPGADDLRAAARAAAQCALANQAALASFSEGGGRTLSQRVGLGVGPVSLATVGGINSRWELVAYGPAVDEATRAAAACQPGETVAGATAWRELEGAFAGAVITGKGVRIQGQIEEVARAAAPRPALSSEAAATLVQYIPAAIRRRLAAHQSAWLAEWRRLTVIFVNLPELALGTPLETIQHVVQSLQEAIYRFEGSINKLSVDEKGVTLIAAMGLPPLAHEDDAERGVRATLEIRHRLDALNWHGAIGLATGRVFCGTVGCETRCEYTIIGTPVNLASRLMQAAGNGILCDAETHAGARAGMEFLPLPPIALKGLVEKVQVFRPLGEATPAAVTPGDSPIFGRVEERRLVQARLERVVAGRPGGVLVIEGEAGMGKSRLTEAAAAQAAALGVSVRHGRADAIERSTAYFAWREIFRRLLEEPGQDLEQALSFHPEGLRLAPLLNVVLSQRLPENDATAAMSQEARETSTNALLCRLLDHAAAGRPLAVILEDCHWLDSASWSLAREVAVSVPGILLLLVTRPLVEPVPREYAQILGEKQTHVLSLAPLGTEEALALASQRLGVRALPPTVAALISARAQGNPFYAEELAYALRDSGGLVIADGECQLAPEAELTELDLPETVQGIVTSRIDRLSPEEQLTLKVASVIGQVFSCRLLGDIFPIKQERARWPEDLENLRRLNLTRVEETVPEPIHAFRHVTTQEVTYNLMPPAQRSQLHRSAAEWHERIFAADLQPWHPLLARHWSRAEVPEKALEYLEKSAHDALRNYANEEVVRFLQQALAIAREHGGADPDRKAVWRRLLGEAFYNLGEHLRSLGEFRESLRLLGYPMPRSVAGNLLACTVEMVKQAVHRLAPCALLSLLGPKRERALEGARAYERVAELMYMNNATVPTLHGAFKALNLAEPQGSTPELARTYANVAVVAGVMMLHAFARANARRARATAEQVREPACTAYVNSLCGLYYVTVADWPEAERNLTIAMQTAKELGARTRWTESAAIMTNADLRRGHFAPGLERAAEIAAAGRRFGSPQSLLWGLTYQLQIQQIIADAPAAEALLRNELAVCLAEHSELPLADQTFGYGVLAWAQWRRGEVSEALKSATRMEQIMRETDQIAFYLLESFSGLAGVLHGRLEHDPSNTVLRATTLTSLRRLCGVLGKFRLMYPIGRTIYALQCGRLMKLSGNPAKAIRLWRRALSANGEAQIPYQEALLHAELARAPGLAESARETHRRKAHAIFTEVKAVRDLATLG